jgi:ABC-type transporter Mla MlaB component
VRGADLPALCERVRAVLDRDEADLIICDLGAVPRADLGTVEVLARLQLTARRGGSTVQVRRAPAGLAELLRLVGLDSCLTLGVEPGGQAEEREEPGGVQEERDLADPTV